MADLQARLNALAALPQFEGTAVRVGCPGEHFDDGDLPCEDGQIGCGFEEFHYAGGSCPHCGGKGRFKHWLCDGKGFTGSTDLAVWFAVTRNLVCASIGTDLSFPFPPAPTTAKAIWEAFVSALEKYMGVKHG